MTDATNTAGRPAGGGAMRAVAIAAGAAATLAAVAGMNHLAARRAERRSPPQGRFVRVDGVRLHYRDLGPTGASDGGPPIVVIHGNGSLTDDFVTSGVAEMLAVHRRVILFDRPGYGYSERPSGRDWSAEAQAAMLGAAARRIGVGRAIVVGHSWGVLAALAWGLARPGDVAALVLISGYYYPSPRLDAVSLGVARLPVLGRVITDAVAPVQARIVGALGNRMIFAPRSPTRRYRRTMPFGLMVRPGQVAASADDGAHMPANAGRLAARYAELGMPITVIWGDGDKLVDQRQQSVRLVEAMPRARAVKLADLGHMLHHNLPGTITREIMSATQ